MRIEDNSPRLLWQPLHATLRGRFASGDPLSFVVSPFVKADALAQLIDAASCGPGLKFVVRWRAEDLLSGVSDLEIYPFLKERGVPLYASARLHMKLYVCDSNWALATSANLTQRGLGFAAEGACNIESGCGVTLTRSDWIVLHQLIHESRLVTDDVYARLATYVAEHGSSPQPAPPIDIFGPGKMFTLAALPASDTPSQLEEFYFAPNDAQFPPEVARRAFQDLATFQMRPGCSPEAFRVALKNAFLESAFVQAFLRHLRANGSLRFGAVTEWIHRHCEDVPLPYRSDVKQQVRVLIDWLAAFATQTRWDRPKHSQVIHWVDVDSTPS